MPEEIVSYFEKKYLELKEKAKTYGELKLLLDQEWKDACFNEALWGILLHEQLKRLLENDMGSLYIS